MKRTLLGTLLVAGIAALIVSRAEALLDAALPLQDIIRDSTPIFTVKVESVDPDKPSMTLTVDEALKDKVPFKEMKINLTGDADAKNLKHHDVLYKRVAKDVPLIIFLTKKKDDNYVAFGFTNGTWLQLTGSKAEDSDKIRWQFTHCEPGLRGTYKGTTEELKQLVADVVAGKKTAPPINRKEKPGFGPELEQKDDKPKGSSSSSSGETAASYTDGPPLAVIPSVVVGGPLALLAMLFPALFGGLLLVLRRWMAALTVASINSMLYMVYSEFSSVLEDFSWLDPVFKFLGLNPARCDRFLQNLHLEQPLVLWVLMLLVTLAGTIWAWRRHLAAVQAQAELTAFDPERPTMLPFFRGRDSQADAIVSQPQSATTKPALPPLPNIRTSGTQLVLAEGPRTGELIVLAVISALGAGGLVYCILSRQSLLGQPWLTLLVMWLGIWCATLYATFLWLTKSARSPLRSGLPLEGVILLVMSIAGAAFAGTFSGTGSAALVATSQGQENDSPTERSKFVPRGIVWKFQPPGKGVINSSPIVDSGGEHIYVATVIRSITGSGGMLYCLEKSTAPESGREEWTPKWKFNANDLLMEVFSSPCLVNGKIYIGEGFHKDRDCMMRCVDAETGEQIWQFRTSSHTESSPFYWDSKVYFGAGDDGMYCVDAGTGDTIWQYQIDSKDESQRLHIDANPIVIDGRVYCGSGQGDKAKSTAIFCLDARTGMEIWRRPTDLPVWGQATVDDDRVYFGVGNETFGSEEDDPKGASLCVNRKTGETIWRFDTKGSVLSKCTAIADRLYFGSRDGNFFCLNRETGKIVWKQELGSPVLLAPTIAHCQSCGAPLCVYVFNNEGKLFCLNVASGEKYWTFDVLEASGIKVSESYPPEFFSTPYIIQSRTDKGEIHRLIFGAGIGDDLGYKALLMCFEAEVVH